SIWGCDPARPMGGQRRARLRAVPTATCVVGTARSLREWKGRCAWFAPLPTLRRFYKTKRRGIAPAPFVFRKGARLLQRLLVRIDRGSGLLVVRREHGLVAHALPQIEAGAVLDVVVLHLHHSGLGPFAARTIRPVAHDGLVRVLAQIVGDL